MTRLFSYVLRYDCGAAPNPFWGTCTLAICKPAIRRKAEVGNWVVGTGSMNSPIGNVSGRLVYAMKVTNKMTLKEYDHFCRQYLPEKIPNWFNGSFEERVGDCIYDYSNGQTPELRPSVHTELNLELDLSGEFVLLSEGFYYFGNNPIPLVEDLAPIVKTNQGHKTVESTALIESFESWICRFPRNQLNGQPQLKEELTAGLDVRSQCSYNDYEEDESSSEEVVC